MMPQTIVSGNTALGQSFEVNFENGHKVLNSANANYSFGSLHQIMLKGLVAVLKHHEPKRILMLGLGAGSALKILANKCHWPYTVDAVEIDADIVALAKQHFDLDQYNNLSIMVQDAQEAVKQLSDNAYDLIIDDVFLDDAIPVFCATDEYLLQISRIMSDTGIYWRNTMAHSEQQISQYHILLERCFNQVQVLEHKQFGNKLYFCQNS